MPPSPPPMPRHAVIQAFLDLYTDPSYLEIGVQHGKTFNQVQARRKIAVDPEFKFTPVDSKAEQSEITHHACSSDDYFGRIISAADFFDVIFIDGLHTFEQTLRDLMNSIACLKPGGVIIIDDVIPNSLPASLPDQAACIALKAALAPNEPHLRHEYSWMGDVFKLAFTIETFLQMFSYATVRENHGQLILWRQSREAVVPRPMETIARLTFQDTVLQRCAFKLQPIAEILAAVHKNLANATAPSLARPSAVRAAALNVPNFPARTASLRLPRMLKLRQTLGKFTK